MRAICSGNVGLKRITCAQDFLASGIRSHGMKQSKIHDCEFIDAGITLEAWRLGDGASRRHIFTAVDQGNGDTTTASRALKWASATDTMESRAARLKTAASITTPLR